MANTQPTQESENETEFTCEICIEPNTLAKKFRNADKCSHPFCTDCVITYIRSKLEDDNTGKIKCPAPDCVHMLDSLDCANLIGRPMFLRWSDVLCEAAVIGQDKCYCPCINCNELILNECGGKPKKTQCPKCKNWFCFHCKIDWHSGFRCDESLQLRDDNDVAFGRLAESNNWRQCPQCSHYCEKGMAVKLSFADVELCFASSVGGGLVGIFVVAPHLKLAVQCASGFPLLLSYASFFWAFSLVSFD